MPNKLIYSQLFGTNSAELISVLPWVGVVFNVFLFGETLVMKSQLVDSGATTKNLLSFPFNRREEFDYDESYFDDSDLPDDPLDDLLNEFAHLEEELEQELLELEQQFKIPKDAEVLNFVSERQLFDKILAQARKIDRDCKQATHFISEIEILQDV